MSNDKMRERFEAWHETRRVNIISEADRITAEKIADGWSDSVVTSAESTYEAIEKITGNNSSFVPFQAGWQAALEHKPDTGLFGSLGKNWTEDSGHENGNYTCKCGTCGCMFLGHKRRVTCKECAVVSEPAQVSQPVDEDKYSFLHEDANDGRSIFVCPPTQASKEYFQFLTDVMTAAGLVSHGKKCKALGERLGIWCMTFRTYAKPISISPPDYEALKLRVAELEAESRTKHEYAMQMLGERDRLQSECEILNVRLALAMMPESERLAKLQGA